MTSAKANGTKICLGTLEDLKMKTKKEKELQGLVEEFFAHKVSVAGISNIVDSRSPRRRFLWFLGVLACTLFMGYMTLKVILEYQKYPKNLVKETIRKLQTSGCSRGTNYVPKGLKDSIRERRGKCVSESVKEGINSPIKWTNFFQDPTNKQDIILPKLYFPAVTICSLNPISSHYVQETSLRKFSELREMMEEEASFQRFDIAVRDECYVRPLCKWSWFQEKCHCVDNPCLTEFCLADNSTHCTCSSSFCNSRLRKLTACRNVTVGRRRTACKCEGTSTSDSATHTVETEDLGELLGSISNPQVREVVRLIKSSKTYDLMGVEEALMPSTDELYEYGTTFDSLVSACSFEGDNCHRENFTVLYHPNYGKCFMFNYIGYGTTTDVEKPVEIRSYGSTSGLQLLLRVTDRNALDLFRREIGARIVLHDPHMLPFVAEYGVNVRPRDMTTLEVSMSKIHRLPHPWGNCEDENKRMYNGDAYSILGCEKFCGYKQMTARCNCTMRHFLRGAVLNRRRPPFPLCNLSDEVQRSCSEKVSLEIEKRTECVCKPPCSETVYNHAVTASELNENYFRTVKAIRTLKLDSKGHKQYINYSDDKSMVGVKVYYNAFQVSNYKEIPSYSWETLVANIGGNFGFFMGLTLVTFLELAEFLWDCICTACMGKQNIFPIIPKQKENKDQCCSSIFLDTSKRRQSI